MRLFWRTEHGTPCTAEQQVDDNQRILDGGQSRQRLMMSGAISHVLEHSKCALGDRGVQEGCWMAAGPGMGARMARCTVKTGAGPGFGRAFSLLGRGLGAGHVVLCVDFFRGIRRLGRW